MRILQVLLGLLVFIVLAGCKATYELCYEHPKYGKICVAIDGKEFKRSDLKPEELAEVEEWLKKNRK